MSVKKIIAVALISVVAAATAAPLSACGGKEDYTVAAGGPVKTLKGVELDYGNMFFDDFVGGVDYDSWYIGNQAWGTGNGGVIPDNVNYTDDGVLVLTGNGEYYTEGAVKGVGARKDGSLTGAALISKFITGPGRYEIKMKVLPRQGACSAFWTYAYDYETYGNHEIDIELPGGKETGSISFENVLNTNYVTETYSNSQDVKLSDLTDGNTAVLNDGQWHTFGFDWYTVEDGEDASLQGEDDTLGKVVYYVDGVVTAVSDFFVPYYQARLWFGVWFPNNTGFVGDANFESDCMYVDWVSYIPFKDQPCVEFVPEVSGVAARSQYPTSPVATENVNKISNGTFEYAVDKDCGWEYALRAVSEIKDPAAHCAISAGIGYNQSCGASVKDEGLIYQSVDSIYGGFKLNLALRAKGTGTVSLVFLGSGGATVVATESINISEITDWEQFSLSATAPAGTKSVEVRLYSQSGKILYADDVTLTVV